MIEEFDRGFEESVRKIVAAGKSSGFDQPDLLCVALLSLCLCGIISVGLVAAVK